MSAAFRPAHAGAQDGAATVPTTQPAWQVVLEQHPARETLQRTFSTPGDAARVRPSEWAETGLTRDDYLEIVGGIADAFVKDQVPSGAIIDRYDGVERQYSTPAFALAAATLVAHSGRPDLLDSATRAMSFAVTALANRTAADEHADFYIPMLMHARVLLRDRVPQEVSQDWDAKLRQIVPEKTYKDHEVLGNWNIVNVCGEAMRRQAGLVEEGAREAQLAYLLRSMDKQSTHFTAWGMHTDGGFPLAYDIFPRMWFEDLLASGATPSERKAWLDRTLTLGGLSTLLLLSPSGEWPSGGRSAHHQWNEAAAAVVCELNAKRWQARGRRDVAGAFKRAARLALTSVGRWQRPEGDLWIVKNRADPAVRHGFEGAYSFNAQYNLLTAAMLAIAYAHADESITEMPTPAEAASYVLDLRDPFRKVVAAAGGTYVLIDTAADARYDATGLQRVHTSSAAISPLSGSVSATPYFGPKDQPRHGPLAPGLAWRESAERPWVALADFSTPGAHPVHVHNTELAISRAEKGEAVFMVRYAVGPAKQAVANRVEEEYTVTAQGLEVTTRLLEPAAGGVRVSFPVLVSDGRDESKVAIDRNMLTVAHGGAEMLWELTAPADLKLALTGQKIGTRNGFMQAAVAELPTGVREATWRLTLERSAK